jgi:hypothetical protein
MEDRRVISVVLLYRKWLWDGKFVCVKESNGKLQGILFCLV